MYKGKEKYKGQVLHSHSYRERPGASSFVGKRVAVVGFGNSAIDLAVELSRIAQLVVAVIPVIPVIPVTPSLLHIHYTLPLPSPHTTRSIPLFQPSITLSLTCHYITIPRVPGCLLITRTIPFWLSLSKT